MTDRRVALVTGANKGIGREIARQLAALDFLVWMGARDESQGQEAVASLKAEGAQALFVHLDVTNDDSVRKAAERVTQTSGRLDVLVNNAGVALDQGAAPSALDIERLKATYEVNVFGPVRVTQAFLPLLRKSPAGRIVMVSSGLGSFAVQTDPANPFAGINLLGYNTSKSALNAITIVFAKELAATNIKVNAANPGYTATDLNQHRGAQSVAEGAAIEVKLATLAADGPTGGFFSAQGTEPW
jgi:NAD(P)-dependent dehydrogenase (short-subunit alcohol dehydrogenase family)